MIVTASSIILKNKKVLVCKRVEHTLLFPGCWTLPGGKADKGESPEETAIRETKEETGLDFNPSELLIRNYFEDRIMYRFLGSWTGEICLQKEELTNYKWLSYKEAATLDFAFDYRSVVNLLYEKGLID